MSRGAFNGYKVTSSWLDGKSANSGAFRTDGNRLYTYGVQLAHRGADGSLVLDVSENWRYSATSNKHMNSVLMLRDNPEYCRMMAEHIRKLDQSRYSYSR